MRIELGHREPDGAAEAHVLRSNAWAAPILPSTRRTSVPRWAAGPTWTPPGTNMIVRHRALDGSGYVVTNDRNPPPGFEIEFDLGLVHVHAQPGTARLISTRDGFFCTPFEGALERGFSGLGFVEQAPLPMLEALELRRLPATGQTVLVAGPADPLYGIAEPLGTLGFVESYPINPREVPDTRHERGLMTLSRTTDRTEWRHRYVVGDGSDGGVALGGLWAAPHLGCEPLRVDADGFITSPLLDAQRSATRRTTNEAARWVVAPLAWTAPRPRVWALRATASRARQLARALTARAERSSPDTTVLGHVLRRPEPGWSPLFAARHPALPEQFLTRSEIEANDMGYAVEGILGYVADRRADTEVGLMPLEIKWASRFGHRRRYIEGPIRR